MIILTNREYPLIHLSLSYAILFMGENYCTKIVFLFHNTSFEKDFASDPMIRVKE